MARRDFLALKVVALILIVGAVAGIILTSLGGTSLFSNLAQQILPQKSASKTVTTTGDSKQDVDSKKTDAVVTLNVRGRSGCLVCHSDKDAVGIINGKRRPIFVDETLFEGSPHQELSCLSCHLDFSYTHPVEVVDYKKIAGLACSKCHTHSKEALAYRTSVHGRLALSGDPKAGATCADCHGAHNIRSLKKSGAYKAEFRASAWEVCGKCHRKFYVSYNDYYHGRAYKRGAPDAPTCWDCHDFHNVLPSKEGNSSVSKANLAKTCGRCHQGSTAIFAEYVPLIHNRESVEEKNLILRYKKLALEWLGSARKPFSQISGDWVGRYITPYLEKLRSWFFPQSLRPKQD